MNISDSVFEDVLMPDAAFRPIHDAEDDDLVPKHVGWEDSVLSLSNRIESLTSLSSHGDSAWLFFGLDISGRQYFMVPKFAIGRPPLRIDVLVPPSQSLSKELRTILQYGLPIASSLQRTASLPITRFLHRALTLWASEEPDFEQRYLDMPFGSRVVIGDISLSRPERNIYLVPLYEVERQWLDLRTLKRTWQDISTEAWPPTIMLDELSLVQQPHDTVTLVCIPKLGDDMLYVYKSVVRDVTYLYHELRMLLSMPPHDNVVSRPLYIVTKACKFGGKIGVCGFIRPYYPIGSLYHFIQSRPPSATTLHDRFRWARQVTSAMIHIQQSPMRYYADLKPDNILMREGSAGLDALLIDLDQKGSWWSWSSPEVAAVMMVECIATSESIDKDIRTHYGDLLKAIAPWWQPPRKGAKYDAALKSKNPSTAWSLLDEPELDRAQVFRLGKLLWCIFEWSACIKCNLSPDNVRERGLRPGFPAFSQATPAAVQHLIRRCTARAPEWVGRRRPIEKEGDRLVCVDAGLREQTECDEGDEGVLVQKAAKSWWQEELRQATAYVEAKAMQKDQRQQIEMPTDGPTLAGVLEFLQKEEARLK